MIMRPSIAAVCLFLPACTTISYQDGTSTFTRTSFGTSLQITKLVARIDSSGTRSISLHGYTSDQAEAMGAVAEGVAKGLTHAVKP